MIDLAHHIEGFMVPRLVRDMERFETSIPGVFVYTDRGRDSVVELIGEIGRIPGYWRRYIERNPVSIIGPVPGSRRQIMYRYLTADFRHGAGWTVFNLVYRCFRQLIRRRGIKDRVVNQRRIREVFDRRFGNTAYGRHLRTPRE